MPGSNAASIRPESILPLDDHIRSPELTLNIAQALMPHSERTHLMLTPECSACSAQS